jgi:hypothetical protein
MNGRIPERDWKQWRTLCATALERFCTRILEEAAAFSSGTGSAHSRYHELFDLLRERNHEMATVFDDQRRSNAYRQMSYAIEAGIVLPAELDGFSDETRAAVQVLIAVK